MRAVASQPTFGFSFGPAEAPGAGPDAPGESATGGASGPAPFAAMLATHLVAPGSRSAPQVESKTLDEDAPGHDDEQVGAGPDPALILPAFPGLAAAIPADAAAVAAVPAPPVSAARAAVATAADVRHVSRDTNDLVPALRERVGRVVARMQREYGHDVRIAEAGRTQGRQDYLFAQGRTRPGPVVTWTRDSAHTRGRAVDVTIDGGYDDATAFARLQQIAQAEGLRTLGARDPGHLELPRDVPGEVPALAYGDGAARVTVESFGVRTEPAPLPGSAQPRSVPAVAGVTPTSVAAVASVAQVAGVASVADVAQVAQVAAAPGVAASAVASHAAPNAVLHAAPVPTPSAAPVAVPVSRSVDHAPSPAPRRVPEDANTRVPSRETDRDTSRSDTAPLRGIAGPQTASAVQAPAAASTSGDGVGRGDRAPDREREPDQAVAAPTSAPPRVTNAPGTAPERAAPAAVAPSERPQAPPVLGAVAAERIARVLDAQAAAAPRTVSHLTLRVERAEGGDDRIRLDLRGRAVETRIDVADLGSADHLAAHAPELRAALARHGFTTDDVRVRSPVGAVAEAVRPDGQAPAERVLDAGAGHAFGDSTPRGGPFEQPSRDPGERKERASDRPASEDPRANDGGRGERRPGDQRQGRRPPPDAYLDGLAPSPAGRPRR